MTPEERLNQAESTAMKALEEVAEARRMLKKAWPWVPERNQLYYYTRHTGVKWVANHYLFFNDSSDNDLIAAGNCYRTEQEAEEVATQRNFMTEYLSAGDESPTADAFIFRVNFNGEAIYNRTMSTCFGARKFSTIEKLLAWAEKWGGESAVVARLQRGWV